MATVISDIGLLAGVGVLADRDGRSAPFRFRRLNLIYGFNGSGKSTLSRLFASLQDGRAHPGLPDGCSFEFTMDDGARLGCPSRPNGLERRLVVFNADYVDRNLQWANGTASGVFFIGAQQADAAGELTRLEVRIERQRGAKAAAEAAEKAARGRLADFRRERARATASRLHLGNRRYEAPALLKDIEAWGGQDGSLLDDVQLAAAEATRRLAQPLASVPELEFDPSAADAVYASAVEICNRSPATAALDEMLRIPEALVWVGQGRELHRHEGLDSCLFCGGPLSAERVAALAAAFDGGIDAFMAALDREAVLLEDTLAAVRQLEGMVPSSMAIMAGQQAALVRARAGLRAQAASMEGFLQALLIVLADKRRKPGTTVDLSIVANESDFSDASAALVRALAELNGVIEAHNSAVAGFEEHRQQAEFAIRRHYVADCRAEHEALQNKVAVAQAELEQESKTLDGLVERASGLRQQVREHGPAADAINKLVASYLGHGELAINPLDEGYELRRHGVPIQGMPSEGEKTAIALSHFVASIEAEGRKVKDLIAVIDDPVSSLDTKALNYACSLVRGRLEGAGQLFVLTHNLQCLNEFRKAWKDKARGSNGKDPTAALFFIDVSVSAGQRRRSSTIIDLPRLLREYDSEYHFLFGQVLRFEQDPESGLGHAYMMPNVLRRVLDVFLAFKCPGSPFKSQLEELCREHPELDRDRVAALERLAQVESHSDNLDDLLSFSSMTLEETGAAAGAVLALMETVDRKHFDRMRRLSRPG